MTLWMLMLLPLLGAACIYPSRASISKWIALVVSLVVFVISVLMAVQFDCWGNSSGTCFKSSIPWINVLGITLDVGVDSVALLLVLLTTLLTPLCVWSSFTAITKRRREYYAWLLILETAMLGVFSAQDLILFYVSFELTLVPMFFLIAIYGGDNRAHASVKFFIYTFTGSLIALAGFIYVAWQYQVASFGTWSFAISDLTAFSVTLSSTEQSAVLLALLAGFAVKIPVFPVHTWLPLAHTEAPTAGSVILAGVLLKLGTFGLYRFVLPMVPDAVVFYAPLIGILAIIGILYAALICWVQDDVKKLIAYSSISHLGFCVLGLIALNPMGLEGAVLYMLNHGLSTGALFFLIGMMYERYHTRDMNVIGGLAKKMPIWSTFMVFFVLSSVGLPGLNGFVSEFMCLIGTFVSIPSSESWPGVLGPIYAAVAALGMVLAAMYLLIMVGKMVFGPLREPEYEDSELPPDLTSREIGVLIPLAALCIWIGVQPTVLTDSMRGSVEEVLAPYPRIIEQSDNIPSAKIEFVVEELNG